MHNIKHSGYCLDGVHVLVIFSSTRVTGLAILDSMQLEQGQVVRWWDEMRYTLVLEICSFDHSIERDPRRSELRRCWLDMEDYHAHVHAGFGQCTAHATRTCSPLHLPATNSIMPTILSA